MTVPFSPADTPVAAVLLAAGSGTRAGGDLPKQFRMLGDRPVLAWSAGALIAHPRITSLMVVTAPGQEDLARAALGPLADHVRIVTGGASRRESVRNALEALAAGDAALPAAVLVHDGARPGLGAAVLDRLIAAIDDGARAAIPVLPVVDTLVTARPEASGAVVDRAPLRRVQTPQAFHVPSVLAAHSAWPQDDEPTDDAQMMRAHGHEVMMIEGEAALEKITLPGDHERIGRLLAPPMVSRTGMGFDVHRLEPGTALWLCGVLVPHSHGLSGHSDADVAIHALVDALLGTLAEGDIGSHFPPSDPQWRGASSDRFLAYAIERIAVRGGILDHVDVTIICEAPKIGPHRAAMRERLAGICGLPLTAISVKATTTERLGLTGRREGIAAQAVASVRLPTSF